MHIETVRFDRIFDVESGNFSFEAGAARQYGVAFDYWLVPRAGASFAVALDEPGNWQKVIGWRDLSTSTVGLKRSAWAVLRDYLWALYLVGVAVPAAALALAGPWAAVLAGGALLLGCGAIVRGRVLYNRRIARALRAVAIAPDAAPV